MTEDLAAWLLEQIAEDERLAGAAVAGPWRYNPGKHWRKPGTAWFEEAVFAGPTGKDAICVAGTGESDDQQSMADAAHIATWDPARVLAECDAKRRIVEHLLAQYEFARQLPDSSLQSPDETAVWETCVRLLALPYAERPGYREEWRP